MPITTAALSGLTLVAIPARTSRIRRQNGIGELIAKARARGAVVRFTINAKARRDEGRSLIASVTVSGLRGVGSHPMGVLSAVERLSAALAVDPYAQPITRAGSGTAHRARGTSAPLTDEGIAAFFATESFPGFVPAPAGRHEAQIADAREVLAGLRTA